MIIDTEAHCFDRCFDLDDPMQKGWLFRYRWQPHPGQLLKEEMDFAGVDQAFLISYDGFDMEFYMDYKHGAGGGPEQFWGGAAYCRRAQERWPDRFYWYTTLRHPERNKGMYYLQQHIDEGAVGIKVFPGFLEVNIDDRRLYPAYELCAQHGCPVIYGFEDLHPPATPTLTEVHEAFGRVGRDFPTINFQTNHMGVCDPRIHAEAHALFDAVADQDNLYISLSCLQTQWNDDVEYPFTDYNARIKALRDAVGIEKLMWGSDWPWLEHFYKYKQLLNSLRVHGSFLNEREKEALMGGNAKRFLGSKVRSRHLMPENCVQGNR